MNVARNLLSTVATIVCLMGGAWARAQIAAPPHPAVQTAAVSAVGETDPIAEMDDFGNWTASSAELKLLPIVAPYLRQRLRINYDATYKNTNAKWPVAFVLASAPWNFSGKCLVLQFTNPTGESEQILASITDVPGQPAIPGGRSGYITVAAGETLTCALNCAPHQDVDNAILRYCPPPLRGVVSMHATPDKIDITRVSSLAIYVFPPKEPGSIIVEDISTVAAPAYTLNGIADQYGQYSGDDWPGKIHSDSDFRGLINEESTDLAAHPAPPCYDMYGGWKSGPLRQATGFFRTEKVNGKWWLVDPDGRLFFSSGFNCVTSQQRTIVDGKRESLFSWLPKAADRLASHYGDTNITLLGRTASGRDFDFYGSNLERKYGPTYEKAWRDVSLRRMRSWGFNTVGNWSPELAPNDCEPYVVTIEPTGSFATITGAGNWVPMPDPFDPEFASAVRSAMAHDAHRLASDPWCLGYFVNNELGWGGGGDFLNRMWVVQRLNMMDAATSPAKRAFVADLQAKYAGIAELSTAWGRKFETWADVDAPVNFIPNEGTRAGDDYVAFLKHFADQYFEVVAGEVHKADPNHLYLGCRFCGYSWEVVGEAARYCDVLSFTDYDRTVDSKEWAFLNQYNKPSLVDEYSFGTTDRGTFNYGMCGASSQAKRAAAFKKYLDSALDSPVFVGAHWFQYTDQPLTGRSMDGENGEYGFVSIADTPYPEMVAAAREEHAGMYERRNGMAPVIAVVGASPPANLR